MSVATTTATVVVRLSAALIGSLGGSRFIVPSGMVWHKMLTKEGMPALTITDAHGIRTSHVQPVNGAATLPPTVI